jgi:hypothetical protein
LKINVKAEQHQAYGHHAGHDAKDEADQCLKQGAYGAVGPVWGF